jgi:hypothetical protein
MGNITEAGVPVVPAYYTNVHGDYEEYLTKYACKFDDDKSVRYKSI